MENNDMIGMLKGILGDDADEKIGKAMEALKPNSEAPPNVEADISAGVQEETNPYLPQIKNIIGQMSLASDSRSKLLMSLRPYMRADRQKSIDNVIRVLNLGKLSGLFK